jgi:hypothetical protein
LTSTTPAPFIHNVTSTHLTTPQACTQVAHTANISPPTRQHDDKDSVTCTYPQPNPTQPRHMQRARAAIAKTGALSRFAGPIRVPVRLGPFAFVLAPAASADWVSGRVALPACACFSGLRRFPCVMSPARPSLDSRHHLTALSRDPRSTHLPSAADLLHCALRSWLSNPKDSRSIYLRCPVLPRVVAQVGSSVRANCCEQLQLPANHARLRRDVQTWARSTSCRW